MELDLSLGDLPSKASGGHTAAAVTTTTTTSAVNKSLGFCMTLGMNSSNLTSPDNPHADQDGDDDDDGDESDNDDDDDDDDVGEEHEKHDEQLVLSHETGGIKDVSVSSQRVSSMNPPVQLDLLPSAPVLRHTPLLWCSDNGSSEGGSSGNAVAAGRRGIDVKRTPVVAGTEEATSSFRLDFMSYGRNGNVNGGSKNHRRGFEIGNDAVEGSSRASDEDDNGMSRKKLRLTKEQSAYLEESFKEHNTLNPKQKLALAEQLNLRPRQVEVWFQNRRARTKLKQTEVDYEYLKRCCETLTEENKRLHKELQELRALKTSSNPFYMQLPATTLTMCPSCERVSTTSAAALPPPSTTLTNTLDQKPKQAGKSSTLSPKPRSLILPVSQAPPPPS